MIISGKEEHRERRKGSSTQEQLYSEAVVAVLAFVY